MKLHHLATLLLLATGPAHADLDIRSQADNPRAAAAFQRLQAAAAQRPPSETRFPSVEQVLADVEAARWLGGSSARKPTFDSPSRPAIEQLGCNLVSETPSGVERKDGGGLNGVMSVYACGPRHVITYEYTYAVELTQRVGVVDDDFARQTDQDPPLLKTKVVTQDERRVSFLRWLNRKHELRYEVYAQAGDEAFEKTLDSVLRATALGLSKG